MTPIEILINLYPRVNDTTQHEFPNGRNDDARLDPPTNYFAVVLSDLSHALVTFASMTMKHDLNFLLEPTPDDPATELKRHVRMNTHKLRFFADELYAKADVALGPPGSKKVEELTEIRRRLLEDFGVKGRVLTAEIWGWIGMMAALGLGEML